MYYYLLEIDQSAAELWKI